MPPRCDDPDVRIVSAAESKDLFDWLAERWNNWRLPLAYLEVAALLGWRITEIASMREEDLLADGYVRVTAQTCKTRRHKYGWLPPELAAEVQACSAGVGPLVASPTNCGGLCCFGSGPHHAAKIRDFAPDRLVGWLQDELKRFHVERQTRRTRPL